METAVSAKRKVESDKRRLSRRFSCLLVAVCLLSLFAPAGRAQMAPTPMSLPLYFEANQGQVDAPAQFITRGKDSEFLISPDQARLVLVKMSGARQPTARTVRMQFVGASKQARISGDKELSGKINYLIGNDASRWHTGVTMFERVQVGRLYPGVNLTYYGNHRQLEYDFTVAPGADAAVIAIQFDGADKISISPAGELVLTLGDSEIRQPKPDIYQIIHGARKEIRGGYKLLDTHTVGFSIGDYDRSLLLVIDPILSYSTYFGGNSTDIAWAVAVDTNGFVYVAGQTLSTQFAANQPLSTPGAFQTNFAGGGIAGDAFVAKLDNLGTNLIYLTYLGGNGDDAAYAIEVDSAGDAYIAGATASPNFPIKNAIYTNIGGTFNQYAQAYLADAFVAELNPGGSNLIYSTFLGGVGADAAEGIALDSNGDAYVTGFTYSTNFPTTTNAFQTHIAVSNWLNQAYYNPNAFVAEIAPGGTSLVYSTYLGGTNFDEGQGIAVDSAGSAYVTGFTASTNFPNVNSFQKLLNGATNLTSAYDAFVTKLSPFGTNLVYSTFLGGTNNDVAKHIAVDSSGNAYVTGWTVSTNFPNTLTNVPWLFNGLTNNTTYGYLVSTNAFLTQITWNGTNAAIGYSAIFGGTNLGITIGYGLALDPAGNVFVCGGTSATNFPVTTNNIPDVSGCLRATNSGNADAFIIVFNSTASGLIYSAFLGGSQNDVAYSLAVDTYSNAYVVGQTFSSNFPTNNALHAALNGSSDAFLAKIFLDPPLLSLSARPGRGQVSWDSGLPFEPELPRLFRLESNTNLYSTNWVTVPQTPVLTNNRYSVTFNPTNKVKFFRLRAH